MNAREVGEVAELGLVDARSWRRSAAASPTCAITTPISPAGTCTHGNFFTPKIGQSLKRRPGISSVGLVAGLAVERDRVVVAELAEREALRDQPDLGRADRVERLPHHDHDQRDHDDADDDLTPMSRTSAVLEILSLESRLRARNLRHSVSGSIPVTPMHPSPALGFLAGSATAPTGPTVIGIGPRPARTRTTRAGHRS